MILTIREREVLQLIAEGCATKEIAARLGIARKTVEFHRNMIHRALGKQKAIPCVTEGLRLGLVTLPGIAATASSSSVTTTGEGTEPSPTFSGGAR